MQTRRGLGLVLACAGAIVSTHLHPSPPRPGYQHQPSAISIGISIGQARSSRFPGTFLVLGLAGAVAIFILFFSLFSLSLFPRFLRMSRATRSRHGYVGRGFYLLWYVMNANVRTYRTYPPLVGVEHCNPGARAGLDICKGEEGPALVARKKVKSKMTIMAAYECLILMHPQRRCAGCRGEK